MLSARVLFVRSGVRLLSGKPLPTALDAVHQEHGGKMVDFAGYSLPVQYSEGVVASHMHTRAEGAASLFDVSHMGQLRLHGADRTAFLESMVVGDIAGLDAGEGRLSLLTTAEGGILDDTVITNAGDHIYMVVNGATKTEDIAHLTEHIASSGMDVSLEHMTEHALVALQGKGAATVLQKFVDTDLSAMGFMQGAYMDVNGVGDCRVTRCGYTGEDGFEVSIPNDQAADVARALLGDDAVLPAGLAVRDCLRLEAGLCLYGTDIDTTTTPAEATLMWTIAKRRRQERSFLGADAVMDQFKAGAPRKRVGFTLHGAPARHGEDILNSDGEVIGHITSGTFSPILKKPIAMGYVAKGYHKAGTELKVVVRKREVDATVTKMPFVPTSYYKP
eukprot:PLAT5075.1.p1 GENE.PLAT5075.1~~PLAT5075.1.p1  ORF type:complete len:401 (+),score=134.72 PLAT5075.1:38-1204(+)